MKTLSIAILTDDARSVNYIDTIMGDVVLSYKKSFNLDVVVSYIEIGATLPGDTHAPTLANKLRVLDHHGANVLLVLTSRPLMNGPTVAYQGYASQSNPCDPHTVAIVSTTGAPFIDALVVKHEIAHTMGVPHDGDGACKAERSYGYIMAATQAYVVEEFSQCSKDVAASQIAAATCLAPQQPVIPATPSPIPPPDYGNGGAFALLPLILLLALLGRKFK